MPPTPTRMLRVDAQQPDAATIHAAAAILRAGGLVAFPTETVYGLGANALDAAAAQRIFAAKGRPASDPLIVHVAALDQLAQVAAHVPLLAHELAKRFWPGPLTLVLPRHPNVPTVVTAGGDSVAVRMPSHPVALALIHAAGVPIAAPSANRFSRPSPTTAEHVLDDLRGRIDMVLDGGPTPIGLESTVLSLLEEPPLVLRPGGVPVETLRLVVPNVAIRSLVRSEHDQAPAAAPGMLSRHYAPDAPLLVFTGARERVLQQMLAIAQQRAAEGQRVGVLLPQEELSHFAAVARLASLGPRADLAGVGRRLFAGLRELEQAGVDVILTRDLGREGAGLAIWDRLLRASEGRIVDVESTERRNAEA